MTGLGLLSLAFAAALMAAPQQQTASSVDATVGSLRIEPQELVADMFYNGATVRVTARVPTGDRIALLCLGDDERLELKHKGKLLGLLWMNVGDVTFDHVPSLYLLHTSEEVESLAPASVLEQYRIGFAALGAHVRREDGAPVDGGFFGELIKLKESEGLFHYAAGAVRTEALRADTVLAVTEFHLPPKAAPGTYRIVAYAFGGDGGRLLGTGSLRLTRSSTVASISALAREHGLLYGILAVVIAIAVGLLTGFVFGLRLKKGH